MASKKQRARSAKTTKSKDKRTSGAAKKARAAVKRPLIAKKAGPAVAGRPSKAVKPPKLPKRQFQIPLEEMPKRWYNILPDLPEPLPPPMDPKEGESRLAALPEMLLGECLKQEMSADRWIDIPQELQSLYEQAGRPRPLFRALSLERHLKTPARLYYKSEFYSPTGSHKVNTALAQAFYAREAGYERVATETGAGQWGTALAYGASLCGLKCTVYWVRAVYSWKPQRKGLMKLFGAEVYPSPSDKTASGRKLCEKDPNHPGSLGIAISEGLEDARRDKKAIYCLGSVLNHVLLHQTIIGLETLKQFEMAKDYPDLVISCLGGGSNFGGFALPFVGEVLTKKKKTRFIAAQSQAAPNLQGQYKYDFADHAEMTPLLKMYTLGHKTDMDPIKGDGLRYHGCSPIISFLRDKGYIDTVAYPKDEKHVFQRAKLFVQTEGFLPAPESAYSVACAIDEALKCRETGEAKVIAFNISGHGFMDMDGYAEVLGL
jgi:tryptophan synthase beta chain